MCQKWLTTASGRVPLDESRKQGKVIVLHQHDRRRAVDLLEHRLGELRVDARVVLPVGRVENGSRVSDMAEGPERAVREAVVVALFLFRRQPDAAERVGRLVRRHREAPAFVRCLVIAAAAAVRDPDAAGRAHDGVERGHKAACRTNPRDPAFSSVHAVMNVRLAIRDDNDTNAAEALFQQRDKAIARPLRLATGCLGR